LYEDFLANKLKSRLFYQAARCLFWIVLLHLT
jgi:hypothetical protein